MSRHIVLLAAAVVTLHAQPTGSSPVTADERSAAPFDVFEKSILELQEAMNTRRVTARQIVQAYLDRISAYDHEGPALNAIITLNSDALAQADELDRERMEKGPRGPLHAIPVLIKDNFATADMPTSGGTIALATFQPASDAFQVRRLREAGAIILGKTTMHELAMNVLTVASLSGETRNPYDPRRSPGGSSGGTGASIGASFAAAGMGSDTCGSIRVPAAYQSLFGMRGTAGLSSRAGVIPLSSTQDEAGPMARSVTDLAIMMDATVGYDPDDPVTAVMRDRLEPGYRNSLRPGALEGARIGVLRALMTRDLMDGAMLDRSHAALDAMKAQGAVLVDVAIPGLDPVVRAAGEVLVHEFKAGFAGYLRQHPGAPIATIDDIVSRGLVHEAIDARLKRRSAADERDEDAYAQALMKRGEARQMILDAMQAANVDVLAYPTILRPPVLWGADAFGKATCGMSSATGLPALTIPLGPSTNMLPVGMDLLGKPFDESMLLNLAYDWERSAHPRTPPFSTPPLIHRRAPGPAHFKVRLAGSAPGSPVADVAFIYDPLTAALRFTARISKLGDDVSVALTLQRSEDGKPGPVLELLLRAGQVAGESELRLSARTRADLTAGRLFVHLYTRALPLGAGRVAIPAP